MSAAQNRYKNLCFLLSDAVIVAVLKSRRAVPPDRFRRSVSSECDSITTGVRFMVGQIDLVVPIILRWRAVMLQTRQMGTPTLL